MARCIGHIEPVGTGDAGWRRAGGAPRVGLNRAQLAASQRGEVTALHVRRDQKREDRSLRSLWRAAARSGRCRRRGRHNRSQPLEVDALHRATIRVGRGHRPPNRSA